MTLARRYQRAAGAIRIRLAELGLRELAQASWLPHPELVPVRQNSSAAPARSRIFSLTFVSPALLEAAEAREVAVAIGADPDRVFISEQTNPPTVAFWRDLGWSAAEQMRTVQSCLARGWQRYTAEASRPSAQRRFR